MKKTIERNKRGMFSFALQLVALFACPFATSSSAEESLEAARPHIVPGLKIENRSDLIAIYSILSTYQIISSDEIIEFGEEKESFGIDFLYVSGENYIENRRVNVAAIDMLEEQDIDLISSLDTVSEKCFVESFVFQNGVKMTLGVHNEDGGNPEDVYKCFTVSLWYFARGSADNVDVENWKSSIVHLMSSLR